MSWWRFFDEILSQPKAVGSARLFDGIQTSVVGEKMTSIGRRVMTSVIGYDMWWFNMPFLVLNSEIKIKCVYDNMRFTSGMCYTVWRLKSAEIRHFSDLWQYLLVILYMDLDHSFD